MGSFSEEPMALAWFESARRFAGVMLAGVTGNCRVKKPAMLCCFEPGLALEELDPLGAARGVLISFPSMPRAIIG